jgi:hypothetical protein
MRTLRLSVVLLAGLGGCPMNTPATGSQDDQPDPAGTSDLAKTPDLRGQPDMAPSPSTPPSTTPSTEPSTTPSTTPPTTPSTAPSTAPSTTPSTSPSPSPSPLPLDVRGVYLVTTPQSISDGTTQSGIAIKGVDGILVNTAWNRVQSDAGVYDFSEINSEAQLAVNAGLKFEIALKTGGSIPRGWVVGQKGAKEIDVPFAPKGGAGGCNLEQMAIPWDPIYLAALDDLLAHLAQDLKDQGLYSQLTMVRLTSINGQSDELRLPAQAATVATCLTNASGDTPVSLWANAGYRPGKLLTAWNTALASYQKNFPDKVFNVAVIQASSLPPIDDEGNLYTGSAAQTQITGQVVNLIAAAAAALPGQLLIQWNGVSDQATDADPANWATTYNERFGFQSNEWGGESNGAECGPDPADDAACTHATLQALLDNGIHPISNATASYFELFAPNFIQFPGLAAYAHNQIFAQ